MSLVAQWKKWIRPLVLAGYGIVLIVALPLMIVEFQLHDTASHLQAWFIGGLFVILAVPISVWGILQHLVHYNQPDLQKYIVRILWMVPIYAINAWLGLRFTHLTLYLDTARECYEAYVIYNFMSYLLVYLRTQYPHLEDVIACKPQTKHLFPFCLIYPWNMGTELISKCKHGVLQYTVVRPVTTVIALICELSGAYSEGEFSLKAAWLYLVIINNISQIWAMYCLILFYQATKQQLAPIKPVFKFMCVKAVVFLSFWQAVLIAALVKLDVIKATDTKIFSNVKDVANALQDFCICIEMFLAALAHYFSFSHKPYIDQAAGNADCWLSFKTMWDVSDVRDDVVDHLHAVSKQASGMVHPFMVQGTASSHSEERTPLLQEPSSATQRQTFESSETFEVIGDDDLRLNNSPPGSPPSEGLSPSHCPSTVADLISVNTFESSSDSFIHRPATASMTNFIQFSDSSIDVVSSNVLLDIDCASAVTGAVTGAGTRNEVPYLENARTYKVAADIESTGDHSESQAVDASGHVTSISPVSDTTSDVAAGDTMSTVLSPNMSNLATGWTEKVDPVVGADVPYLTVDSGRAVTTTDMETPSDKTQDIKPSETSLM